MTQSQSHECLRQAVLVGAPKGKDVSMHNDLAVMHKALQARGLAPAEILSLEGNLDRQILTSFFKGVGRRISQWSEGELFLYLSGHGVFTGDTFEEARLGIMLREVALGSSMRHLYWEEAFSALSIPEAVTCTMLIDH